MPTQVRPGSSSQLGNGRGEGKSQVFFLHVATFLGAVLTIAGLIQMVLEDFADLAPLMAIAPLAIWGLYWLVRKLAEPADLNFLMRVMIGGMLLRLGLTLVVHYSLPVWFFAPDQVTYEQVGGQTLRYLQGREGLPWQMRNSVEVGYFYWNAFLFFIFGYAPLAPKLVNAFVGTASALLCYRIAGELAGRGPARIAAGLTMFFPSLVLWSSLNLRDPMVLLLTLTLFYSAVRLRTQPSARAFLGTVLSLSLLVLFRDYIAVMAVFGLVGASIISEGRGLPMNLFIGVVLLALAYLAYQQLDLGSRWVESASFEAMATQRSNLATGGSAFRPGTDISTPLRGLQFFPLGLAFFLLSPFPWQLGSMLTLMTLPEQLVWYTLLPTVVMGGRYLIKNRTQAFGPILIFVVVTTSVYALVEGNAGTAYRHRAQVLVFFLIMASVGLELRRRRREAAGARHGRRRR